MFYYFLDLPRVLRICVLLFLREEDFVNATLSSKELSEYRNLKAAKELVANDRMGLILRLYAQTLTHLPLTLNDQRAYILNTLSAVHLPLRRDQRDFTATLGRQHGKTDAIAAIVSAHIELNVTKFNFFVITTTSRQRSFVITRIRKMTDKDIGHLLTEYTQAFSITFSRVGGFPPANSVGLVDDSNWVGNGVNLHRSYFKCKIMNMCPNTGDFIPNSMREWAMFIPNKFHKVIALLPAPSVNVVVAEPLLET